jgi:predicted O-linked N-acetylglucosamine transferase (SPINDLY family)
MPQLTIEQAIDLASRHHQAGRLQESEQLCRQILAQQPEHLGAIHGLGVIAIEMGRHDIAADLIRRVIAQRPDFPEAHNNLGSALRGLGQLDEAIAACRQAILLRPGFAEAHYNLGVVLNDAGRRDEAITAFGRAVALKPDYAEACSNLGCVLSDTGRLDEAIAAFRQAVALAPNRADVVNNLGNALSDKGLLEDSIAAYRQAILLRPDYAEAYSNLGIALADHGRLDEAIAAYRKCLVLKPNLPEVHSNLGVVLRDKGLLDAAIGACREAIALRHNYPEAHVNLANALKDKGQLDESITAYGQAIALQPNYALAHSNLGSALKGAGRLDEAVAAYRRALAVDPGNASFDSSLVYTLHFHPAYDANAVAEEHRRWNRRHAEPLGPSSGLGQRHPNDRSPDRRLRIGYVSPDFCGHVVGDNLLPLFLQHDRGNFEIICYANVRRPDAKTTQFQQNADCWRNIAGLSDEHAASQIRDDRIDILVDLTLHMANNRLLIFARKPAPVQVTFAGYPGSTGLNAIDYRLSDSYLDPPGIDESIYSEKTIRLPDSFWCYDPLDCRDVPVNPLPALPALSRVEGSAVEGSQSNGPADSGIITFGCLNNFCKINDGVLALWAQVLRQVERSRLLLLSAQGSHRRRTLEQLSQEGIDPARIEFASFRPRRDYLELYHRIDVGLDSFPYNGHTTSLDSFWMGVPVVTLVGQTAVSRAGWCQLSNLGLTELAAHTPDQFVRIAVELAGDLPRLKELRATLRQRMERSPLMDAPKFARSIEAAYRQMWKTWCEGKSD